MTRGTRGICTGGGAILAFSVLVGCAQQQAAQSSQAVAQAAANPVQTATNAVVAAATGAVNGAVNSATGSAAPARNKSLIKPNGRGGFDSSAAQKEAIRKAHLVSARYGTTKVTRARNGVLAGSPGTGPATASANR